MIIWSGSGILILIPFGLVYAGSEGVTRWLTKSTLYWEQHFLPPFLGGIAAAVAVYFTAKFLDYLEQPKTVIDVESGAEVVVRKTNRLFGIPIRYWHYVAAAIGTIVGLTNIYLPNT
jgi:hypothetical protein